MFENIDGWTDAGAIGILKAHLGTSAIVSDSAAS